jgi:hypothetical protein
LVRSRALFLEFFRILRLSAAWTMTGAAGVTERPPSNRTDSLICEPFGDCQACPSDEVCHALLPFLDIILVRFQLDQPFCQPFGNRRLLHCVPPAAPGAPSTPLAGEIPAWESCGRIPAVERYDFFEFVACNLVLAFLALAVVLVRSKRVQAIQAGRLAARIGFPRT